jgi:hypothetical protein
MGKRTSATWSAITYYYDALIASNEWGNIEYLERLSNVNSRKNKMTERYKAYNKVFKNLNNMETEDKLWIASKYVEKGYSSSDLRYGDDLYHLDGNPDKEDVIDDIMGYMDEYRQIGSIAFRDKYKEYKLY